MADSSYEDGNSGGKGGDKGDNKGGLTRKQFLGSLAAGGGFAALGARAAAQSAVGSPDRSTLPPLQAEGVFEDNPAYYPPSLGGMRGSHPGSYPAGHALRDGEDWVRQPPVETGEHYDVVIVGAGISGLSAAHYYRQRKADARILILENHDDFGGHAKRNEFQTRAGRTLLGYGGTQALEGVRGWSDIVHGLMADIGVEPKRFFDFYDMGFFGRHGLSNAMFFDRETFGRDALILDPSTPVDKGLPRFAVQDVVAFAAFIRQAPIASEAQRDLIALQTHWPDPFPGLSIEQKVERMRRVAFADFLLRTLGTHPDVVKLLQQRTHGGFGRGIDSVDALVGSRYGAPGLLKGIGFPDRSAGGGDPYIYHFPDGNASIARLLVRKLIPDAMPGGTMEDVVLARADYAALDRADQPVRIRLNSTVVRARNLDGGGVELRYMRAGKSCRVTAGQAILACWHSVIPYLCPELPDDQKEAMHANVKVPLIYGSVALRDWRALRNIGVGYTYAPNGYFSEVTMDFPVSMGGYQYTRSPDEPCVLHLVRTPCAPGLPARDQHRVGRADIYATTLEMFENRVCDQLGRMYRAGGFDPLRDIEAITINRWPHGYCYYSSVLVDGDVPEERSIYARSRKRFGNIAIANTDAAGDAETHLAIEQAHRAVGELLG